MQHDIIKALRKAIKNPPVMIIESPIKVTNTINLINGILRNLPAGKYLPEKDYQKVVVFALSWAIGGLYQYNERYQFQQYLISIGAPLPAIKRQKDTIFDFFFNIQDNKGDYKIIEVEKWKPPEKGNVKFSQLFLPTPDSWRADYLIRSILKQPKPIYSQTATILNAVLLVGGSGTAKTSSVLMYSNTFDIRQQAFKRINFSSATSPFNFQNIIQAECDSKVGKNYAPPGGKTMCVFIDDMSMPFVNKWTDQVTNQIVRQLIQQSGFYWLDKAQRGNFKNIKGLSYIGAMNHPGSGRNDIPNRLKRHHFIFNMILPLSVQDIYGTIIRNQFKVDHPKSSGLTDQVKKVIQLLTSASIKLWDQVKKYMLPTPSKFHYVLYMRQLARIFKGILQIKKDVLMKSRRLEGVKPQTFLIALWRHECQRVFVDKLTNIKDKTQVQGYIEQIMTHHFNLQTEVNNHLKGKLISFLDFIALDIRDEEGMISEYGAREYQASNKLEDVRKRCTTAIADYNTDLGSKAGKRLELVLFDDAVFHLLRISRIIKMPRSSALLVGVGGSGKQSLTRLAAYIGRMQTRQIVLAKNYGQKELREDIKQYFKQAGHLGKQTCFILTDSEVKKEQFLEYINMILSTGQIAGLFAKDQKEVIMADVRNDLVRQKNDKNAEPTTSELYSYFVQRTRDNLHLVLCFSPVGIKFRQRSRKFPALFNQCTIDWFLTWPEEALVSVAETDIRKFKQLSCSEEIKQNLMRHMGNVHVIVRDICQEYFMKMRRLVYVTPKSYLSYLKSYVMLYKKKFTQLDKSQQNFTVGVRKIDQAAQTIAIMKVSLKDQEALLKEASLKCQGILTNLHNQQKKAQTKERQVAITAASCEKQANQISAAKAEAEKDLQAALPAMLRAQQAVDSLDNKMITEIKKLIRTPPIVQIILDAVSILMQVKMNPVVPIENAPIVSNINANIIKPSFQQSGKLVLYDINFIKNLKGFDKDSINNQTIQLLQPIIRAQYFSQTTAGKATVAAKSIMKWVSAITQYHEKSQIVKPKRIKLIQEQARLQIAMDELSAAKAELKTITDYLNELDANSSKQIQKKNQLQAKMTKTKKKINTAQTLITSLSDQRIRWKNGASKINQQKKQLIGNCSLATAFISYCGPFNSDFRSILSTRFIQDMKTRKVPVKDSLSSELTSFLVDEATVGEWNLQGLPKDDLSVQNGIMVTNSTRYPLLIDPQGQGQAWIVKKYAQSIQKNRSITTLNHPKFKQNFLKYCIEQGRTLIIENIQNEVDPMLDPVLQKQVVYKKKGNGYIQIGGTVYDYSSAFQLFMTCRLSNPAFSPQLSAKTTIIDFTVTQKGLEQQLLGKVISKQQKALEDSLNQLLTDVNFNKKELQKLDRDLLERLNESSGNLLDDKDLMDVLNSTKTQSKEVTIKLKDSQIKTSQINQKREQYRPVAIRGAALYFTMIEVALMNWMYNSSLEQFLNLFNDSIDNSESAQNPTKRVQNIIKHLTKNVYRYVNRGLFEKDKINYILMICFKILITAGKINSNDVSLFLKAGAAEDIKFKPKPSGPALDWLNGGPGDKVWLNLVAYSKHCFNDGIAVFKDLPQLIQKNPAAWKKFFDQSEPQNYPIPDINEKILLQKQELRAFMKMCLIRSIREDRTIMAANGFINSILGQQYIKPISYPIDIIWAESLPTVPVLFLLSAGADPTSSIDQFARKKKKFPVDKVSMGEGQQITAKKAISAKLEDGGWLVLQNCHLGLKFMQEIDQMLVNWIGGQTIKPNPEFRLWITCQQHQKFPLGLLQKTIKVTNQPPKGVKAGLYKTFTTIINQEFIDKVDHPFWKNIMFTVCFLHSILIQRRKFGPLGWCVPYQFNNSDLQASLSFIQKYLTNLISLFPNNPNAITVNNDVTRYMICQVQYGGRVTDDLDRQLLSSFGQKWLVEAAYNSAGTEFCFADTSKFKYKIPNNPAAQLTRYFSFITEMPGIDQPQIFGLHANADLTFRQKESLQMINTIMQTRPKQGSVSGGKTRQQIVKQKSKQMIAKLPPDYVESEARQTIKKMVGPKNIGVGMSVPLNIFLFQEIQRMQKVLSIVRQTLIDVVDAIDGQIIMTPQILEAINSIDDAKVPNSWIYDATDAQISWIFPSLGTWNNNLYERNNQLSKWLRDQQRPPIFWLGGFFNPQGFLTAMKQQVTRMHKSSVGRTGQVQQAWSLDEVYLKSTVKDRQIQVKDTNIEGVYIRSLFIEGCSWKSSSSGFSLQDSKPRKLFEDFPILHVTAMDSRSTKGGGKQGEDKQMNQYNCPVYKYPKRTDKYLIFRVNLTCQSGSFTKWKQRGVALLCAIE